MFDIINQHCNYSNVAKEMSDADIVVKRVPVRDILIENAYFYIDMQTKHAFLIDPGADAQKLLDFIRVNDLTIEKILLTHGHFDHIGAVKEISDTLKTPYFIHKNGEKYLTDVNYNLSVYFDRNIVLENAVYLEEGALISLEKGCGTLQLIHTPGHTTDSSIFYDDKNGFAFVGDTIFKASVGATTYPGGNEFQLTNSIFRKIFALPDETILYSGHTFETKIITEKNRYMKSEEIPNQVCLSPRIHE